MKKPIWSKVSTSAERQDDPRELPPAEPVGHALVEEDEQDRVDEEEDGPPDHQAAHLVHQPEVERPVGDGGREVVEAHGEDQRHHQEIADEQPVDRLADGRRILADIDEEQHRELAGEEHDRAGRDDDAAGELQVEDRGEIGLEEVHRAEGAEDEADAEAVAQAEQARHDGEVQRRLDEEEEQVGPVAHHEAVPMQQPHHRHSPAWLPRGSGTGPVAGAAELSRPQPRRRRPPRCRRRAGVRLRPRRAR